MDTPRKRAGSQSQSDSHVASSRLFLAALAAGLIALTIFGQLPGTSKFYITLQNSAHAPVFALLALIFQRLGASSNAPPSLRTYLWVWLLCLAIGVAIELIQSKIGGDASASDVFHDLLGAIAALTAHASLHTRGRTVRAGLGCISVATAVAALAPLLFCIVAYINRDCRFPNLATFASFLDLYFLEDRGGNPEIRLLPPSLAATPSQKALSVVLPPTHWPGIELTEPSPDWSGYRNLNIEMANPGLSPIPLNIRVHDRAHNWQWEDRFNTRTILISASRSTIKIPLAEIEHSPSHRMLDMHHVTNIMLYTDAMQAGKNLLLIRVWLD